MITYIDQNNAEQFTAYKALFRKAEAELEMPEGSISTLQQYFAVLGDLVGEDNKKQYTILPLDEEPFKIDANTRIISVPKDFATNGVSVEGDQVAEILYFEIDRYFDAMDLNNQKIVIEWENADGDKKASCEWVRDIDSKPGKIIFGWALDDSITKKAGNVKFAVRFYTIDEDKKRLYYNFGTQIAQVTIKPTLHYDLVNKKVEIINVDELVLKRIQNSITGILPSPEAPSFKEALGNYLWVEGEEGWEKIELGPEDKLNIKVGSYLSAIAEGSGNISYNWYFATKNPAAEDFDPATDWANVEDEVAPFEHTGSVCKVTGVGYYKVIAINTYEANELYQNSTESDYIVKIVGPTAPTVAVTVNTIRVLGQKDENGEDIGVSLSAEVNDANGVVTYVWNNAFGPIEGATGNSLNITEAGEYYCTAYNTFNGSNASTNSSEIKIFDAPAVPTLAHPGYDAETKEYAVEIWTSGEAMTSDVVAEEGKSYVYTWYKEKIDNVDDAFNGIDELTEEVEEEEAVKDFIVTDNDIAQFVYRNAEKARGRNHKNTYTTSASGFYFCKVEEVVEVDGVQYFSEPNYTRIYKIIALA